MFSIGAVISGKYRVVRLLGDGGMGSVYEAEHLQLGSRVAIKVLHPELVRRPGLVERLLREARVAAQIRGPHVVQVFDVDRTPEGDAYIVMELLQGEPLSRLLERERALPVPVACGYADQILLALEAAHAIGVVHRDLKPDNVFVTPAPPGPPVLKLIDFGIAKALPTDPGQRPLTAMGSTMGTVEYMAPEQARSAADVDARADLYAVGVMLFEMLAGALPVTGDDAMVVALRVERGEVAPLEQLAPGTPEALCAVVRRAMAPRPDQRFAGAAEMRFALDQALRAPAAPAGAASHAATVTAVGAPVFPVAPAGPTPVAVARTGRPAGGRRRGAPLAIGILTVLAGVAALVVTTGAWSPWSSTEPAPGPAVDPPPASAVAPAAVPPAATSGAAAQAPPSPDIPPLNATPGATPPPPVHHPGAPDGSAAPNASAPAPSAGHPSAAGSGEPGWLPFPIPPGFPSSLPSIPGLPSLPSSLPAVLPSGFPSALPPGFPSIPGWTSPSPPPAASSGR
jgi:serine/threonine-protein kinase